MVNSTAPHAHTRGMGSQVGQSLWARVLEVYDAAQASGAAMKTDTRLQQIEDAGVSFVLRVVSALRSKPTGISSNDRYVLRLPHNSYGSMLD